MKKIGLALAAAGFATLLSLGAASAQGAATGTGSAVQKDMPSTSGVGNPGGRGMRGMRGMRMKMRHHRRHYRRHRM